MRRSLSFSFFVLFLVLALGARSATPLTDVQFSGTANQVKSGATLTVKSGGLLTYEAGASFGGSASEFLNDIGAQPFSSALTTIGTNGSAYYLARANHTGTQAWSTITGTPTTRAGYGISDAIGTGAITASGLTMATARFLGRTTASTGGVEELTNTVARTMLGLGIGDTPSFAGASLSTPLSGASGGTGYNNGARTLRLDTNLEINGGNLTITSIGGSFVTMPNTGTLATRSNTETFINKTYNNVIQPVYNVKNDYGAACDGSTDDRTAVVNAITAAINAGGGTVYFPGLCKITSTITISSSVGVRLVGGDRNTCGLKASSSTMGALLNITGSNVTVENMRLDGAYSSGAHSGDFGLINLTNGDYVRVIGCLLINAIDRGIRIRGNASDVEMRGNRFSNCFCGIHAFNTSSSDFPTRLTIEENYFVDGWSDDGETGGIKLQTDPAYAGYSRGHRIENNTFKNSGQMGIELWRYIANSVVSGNVIEDVVYGISLDLTFDTTVSGNTVRRFDYIGMEAASACENVVYIGNTVSGYNAAGARAGSYGFVSSNTPPHHLQVVGNNISGVNGTGIHIQTTNDLLVASNQVRDCGTLLVLQACNYIKVTGNEFIGPCSSHVSLYGSSANMTDIEVAYNTFRGDATFRNFFGYNNSTAYTLSNFFWHHNVATTATFTGYDSWDLQYDNAELTNVRRENNFYVAGTGKVNWPDYTSPDLPAAAPFSASIQGFSIPVAAKITFTVPSAAGDRWYKVFSADYGVPLTMAVHVECNFLGTGDNTASSQTFWIGATPYGQDSGILKMPDGRYNAGPLKGIIYNNLSNGSVQEIWLRFPATTGGTVTVCGADLASSWINTPTAVSVAPTWATNSYELPTQTDPSSFKSRYVWSDVFSGTEQASSPSAPTTNGFRIYAKDNGAGKTVLYAKFATGAEQQIAIEP